MKLQITIAFILFCNMIFANQFLVDSIENKLLNFEVAYKEYIENDLHLETSYRLKKRRRYGNKVKLQRRKICISYVDKWEGEVAGSFKQSKDTLFLYAKMEQPVEIDKHKKVYRELKYSFSSLPDLDKKIIVFFNGVRQFSRSSAPKNSYKIVGNDTLNRVDQNGLKDGKWKTVRKSRETNSFVEEKWNKGELLESRTKKFYFKILKSDAYYDFISRDYTWRNYFPNGVLSEETKSGPSIGIGEKKYVKYFEDGSINIEKYHYKGENSGVYKMEYYSNGLVKTKYSYQIDAIEIVNYYDNSNVNYKGKTTIGLTRFKNQMESYLGSGYMSTDKRRKCRGKSYLLNCKKWNVTGDYEGEIELELCEADLY